MTLPPEFEDVWNEDDRLFADGMEAILHQAYNAKGVDDAWDVLLARICVELHAIRSILDNRLDNRNGDEPWKDL